MLISLLLKSGCTLRVYDPQSMDETRRRIGDVVYYAADMYDAAEGADALLLVTEWKQFRLPAWGKVRRVMSGNAIFDGRNIYDHDELSELGFTYTCIGRQP